MPYIKKLKSYIISYTSLILAVIVIFCPIYVAIVNSFKTKEEYVNSDILQLPKSFLNFDNYIYFINNSNLLRGFVNSLFVIAVSCFISVIFCTMVSFILARFDFKLKKAVYLLYIIATVFPGIAAEVPRFKMMVGLGLYNSLWSLIIIYSGTGVIGILLMLQFIQQIPVSLDESVLIDGGSYLRVFVSIILPLVKPATATLIILHAIGRYNDMYTPMLYLTDKNKYTAILSLYRFAGAYSVVWNIMFAGIIITLVPTVILYLILQRNIIESVTTGSVKA